MTELYTYLEWLGEPLAAQGQRTLVVIWDNAFWHVSQQVRSWIRQHNQAQYRCNQALS